MPMSAMPSSTSQPRWYVIQCKPRQDRRALENLQRQGYSCYLPTLKVEKLRHGRKLDVQEALFPGYLFIQLDTIRDNWSPIRSTRGVSQIVRVREQPLPVCNEVVDLIRQRLAREELPVPCFRPGERVLITEGCFAQLEAIFVAGDGAERVMLLLSILQREQTLSFPLSGVRKCANGSSY
jgi:transcriptional antiterminator RfaH